MIESERLLLDKLDAIRRKVETDPDIRKRKEKIILELSRLSYEQLNRILRGPCGPRGPNGSETK